MRLFILIISTFFLIANVEAKIKPTRLNCEYLENPSVIDEAQPRFGWINIADEGERGQILTAYQIRVSNSKENLAKADFWDSKKVKSDQSTRVKYKGKVLQSRDECWWQVRVWDKNDEVSDWSEPAFWRMGFLEPSDWEAQWIGVPWQGEETLPKPNNPGVDLPEELPPPAPMLRKEFQIKKNVENAVVYLTGLGYFELYLNGEKIGDDVLVPNQTNYGKRPELPNQSIPLADDFREYRVMYLAYDLTLKLQNGENVIGGILGNGFYNPAKFWALGYGTPRFLAQLHITYTDGTEDVIVSDPTWKASKSPILMDMVYYGEHYDARLEQDNWCMPGFDDSEWENVVIRKAPEGKLVAHTAYPDKVMERLKPIHVERKDNGNYLVDFGVEISGWVRMENVEGPRGHKTEIKYLGIYSGDNSYVFSGKGKENYAARFNWFVFREVEIVNWPGELNPDQLTAEVVHTYVEESADFETSNTLFNNINKIWRRSQTDNMHGGIASDCPHRERAPYTGDGQVACVTVMHNYDSRNFYHKWIQDIIGAQIVETGYIPNGAPWEPGCGGGAAWGAAISIMPWEFYLHYGSKDILEDSYPAMKEYIRYMQTWMDEDGIVFLERTGSDGNVLKWFNLGEWMTPGELPADDLVHTFYFWRCADLTSKSAKLLGKTNEAKYYSELAETTKKAFHKRFYNEDKGSYGASGGNVFALKMGVPKKQYQKVVAALKNEIINNKGHLTTGIFGTQFFFEILSENGMHDLAYEAMNKTDAPGYGHWLEVGATTTFESWPAKRGNHPMFGGGLVWFYRKLAGMNTDENEPAYKHIVFKPQPVEDVSFVKYYNQTVFGEAGIHWQKANDTFKMEISVPVGSHATVYVPAESHQKLTENGNIISESKGVDSIDERDGYIILRVKSGDYKFHVE